MEYGRSPSAETSHLTRHTELVNQIELLENIGTLPLWNFLKSVTPNY
jgi:hypothetical protein